MGNDGFPLKPASETGNMCKQMAGSADLVFGLKSGWWLSCPWRWQVPSSQNMEAPVSKMAGAASKPSPTPPPRQRSASFRASLSPRSKSRRRGVGPHGCKKCARRKLCQEQGATCAQRVYARPVGGSQSLWLALMALRKA